MGPERPAEAGDTSRPSPPARWWARTALVATIVGALATIAVLSWERVAEDEPPCDGVGGDCLYPALERFALWLLVVLAAATLALRLARVARSCLIVAMAVPLAVLVVAVLEAATGGAAQPAAYVVPVALMCGLVGALAADSPADEVDGVEDPAA